MVAALALVAVLGAIGATAHNPHAIRGHIVERQLSATDIPSACQSTCSGAIQIYQACVNQDLNNCLKVCQPSEFSDFSSCLQCIIKNNPDATDANTSAVNQALDQLEQLCDSVGSTVSASLGGGGVAAGSTGAATSSMPVESLGEGPSASATTTAGSGASTSAAGGLAGGSQAATSKAASASQAAGSAASAASGSASAKPSGGASTMASLPINFGAAVALVGVVAGAAAVF